MAEKKATSAKDKKKNGASGGKKTAAKSTPAKKTPAKKKTGGNGGKRDTPPPDAPKQVLAADLPDGLRTAMNNLVNYSWDDEMRSAEEFARENGGVEGHVFADLVTVRNFLEGKNDDPMDLLDLDDEDENDEGGGGDDEDEDE